MKKKLCYTPCRYREAKKLTLCIGIVIEVSAFITVFISVNVNYTDALPFFELHKTVV